MKRFLLGGIALIALTGIASAADMATKYPVKAPPPPVPSYDWNGFYLGAYWGNSISHATASTPGTPGAVIKEGAVGINDGGWIGGIEGGYDWQFSPSWLVGLAGDFGYFGGKRLFEDFDDTITVPGIKTSWSATARGRIGYVTGPSVLYVTGGVGFVHVTDDFGGFVGAPTISPISSATTSTGGAIGAGIETKLSRNWSTKTEYIYIDGGGTHSFTAATGPGSAPVQTNFTHNFQMIKTGLDYKLDGNWDGLPFFNAPMLASNHNWNGFYLGGNAGVGTSLTQTASYGGIIGGEDLTSTGFTGGGEAGYNYMLWNRYLVGIEGDFGALSMHRTVSDWFDPGVTFSEKTDWLATIRGRFGTTTGPALLYMTGGLARVHFQDGIVPNPTNPGAFGGPVTGGIVSKTGQGWTFGGGTEVALDQHWSAKLESLYIRSGTTTTVNYTPAFPTQFKERFVVVRAGLNYQFN